MRKPISVILLALTALLALLVPAAVASAKTSKKKTPSITRVSPMRVGLKGTITIRGKNFSSRRVRNTVIFRAPDGRTAFVKPTRASSTKLVVKVPAAVTRLFSRSGSKQLPTRFKLRVLSGRFGKFTVRRLSPVIVPAGFSGLGPLGGGSGGSGSVPACGTGNDWDGDLLSNATEASIGTDPCLKDTDRDGVDDGYEYKSAIDLNNDDYQNPNSSLPYPGKRPYANPLDPSDANVDYDGDTLSLAVEQKLWKYSTPEAQRTLQSPLSYSDGLQYSIYTTGPGDRHNPALSAAGYSKQAEFVQWAQASGYRNVYIPFKGAVYGLFDGNLDGTESSQEGLHYDRNGDGFLSDDERDEDADGLSNYDENNGRTQPDWWASCYSGEAPYYVHYAGTDLTDADTDGDGVRDGADDQDHDDLPNVMELSRIAASGIDDREPGGKDCELAKSIKLQLDGQDPPAYWHQGAYGRVNPFNPCLPVTSSRTCNTHTAFGAAWAPFDDSVNWLSLN